MNKLDFLIIGAQKSATTALYRYLQSHPDIAMPLSKEAPLFTADVNTDQVNDFMHEQFGTTESKLFGKASPQYMCDEAIPARIAEHNPQTKLIAVLREPVDRAWSHYRMNRRRGTENRSFDEAVVELMQPANQALARDGKPPLHHDCFEPEGDFYLAWGEYGRILQNYLRYFDRSQILVIFTDELKAQPDLTFDRVLAFIDLKPGFRPDTLGEIIHQGGDDPIIPNDFREGLKQQKLFRTVWECFPDRYRQAIRYWYEQLNVKTSSREMEISQENFNALSHIFKADALRLYELTGRQAPWLL